MDSAARTPRERAWHGRRITFGGRGWRKPRRCRTTLYRRNWRTCGFVTSHDRRSRRCLFPPGRRIPIGFPRGDQISRTEEAGLIFGRLIHWFDFPRQGVLGLADHVDGMEFVMVNRLAVLVPPPKAAGSLVLGHPEAQKAEFPGPSFHDNHGRLACSSSSCFKYEDVNSEGSVMME